MFLEPWRLRPHRVSRFYLGGKLLEEFRGASPDMAGDGDHPEDWVGSATRAWTPPGKPPSDEGLAEAEVGGELHRVADLLVADPIAVAGRAIVDRFGVTTGVLAKLLDAAVRLPIHAHPSRSFASTHLGSPFGKAEAWIVLRTRSGEGDPPPTVRIGFRHDVGREELVDWIEGGRTRELLGAMHERPTAAGDVWFIPPGVPHAIGAGIFMLEVEEPTDYSIVAELRDVPIDPADAHLRLGWEVTIDAFDRNGHDDAWLDGLLSPTRPGGSPAPVGRERLTTAAADPYFEAERLVISGSASGLYDRAAFLVGVVTAGSGRVRTAGGELPVQAGETFAVPAATLAALRLEADERLELIACLPPDARRSDDESAA
jgi:mannose-6-phosphate isomerase